MAESPAKYVKTLRLDYARQLLTDKDWQLEKTTEQSAIMNAQQVLNFSQYFQRLTEHGFETLPLFADTTFFLDENRHIHSVQIR